MRSQLGVTCGLLLATAGVFPSLSTAQERQANAGAPPSTVTTDTSTLVYGRTTFARYDTPGMCLAAVWNARDVAQRNIEFRTQLLLDSLQKMSAGLSKAGSSTLSPVFDSLPDVAVMVARNCSARFTAAETPAPQLADLMTLALAARNDSLATAVTERRLSLASRRTRDEVWMVTIGAYLGAQPARVAAAESLVTQFDASPKTTAGLRVAGHGQLLQFASARFDRARMRREIDSVLAITARLSESELSEARHYQMWDVLAVTQLLTLTALDKPDSMLAVATRMKPLLDRRSNSPFSFYAESPKLTPSQLVEKLIPEYQGARDSSAQSAYTFPKAAVQYAAPGNPDTTGRATLRILTNGNDLAGSLYMGWSWLHFYTQIREWQARYGDRLSIVLVSQSSGYWNTGRPGADPVSVAEEAQRARYLYQEYLKLPVRVEMLETPFEMRADGRRMDHPIIAQPITGIREEGVLVLTDARGHLLYNGRVTPMFNALLEQVARSSDQASTK